MASGVKVADEVVQSYQTLKLKKNIRHMIMYIHEEDGLIKVQSCTERNSNKSQEEEFNDFVEELPKLEGRYCLLDLTIPQKNGAQKDVLFLITWCPDGAPMKSNIMYTTSKKALTDKIREGTTDIQANDLSDLEYKEFLAKGCK